MGKFFGKNGQILQQKNWFGKAYSKEEIEKFMINILQYVGNIGLSFKYRF